MRFIKSFFRGLASSGFKLSLILLAVATALLLVFGTSGTLKRALKDSKAYDTLIDSIISDTDTSTNSSAADSSAAIALNQPQIKQAAKAAFTPALLQSTSEQIIDSVYGWLRSGTANPDFRIDLSEPKQRFADGVAAYATDRAKGLPTCSLQQLRELAGTEIDPLNIPCLPAGYDLNVIHDKVVSDILNSQNFLENPVITSDNLPKDSQGKTVFENLQQAPRIFHWLRLAPWIIGGSTLLSALLLLALHDDKERGLRSIAMTLLGSGLFLLIGTVIFSYAFNKANQPYGQVGKMITTGLQGAVLSVLRSLNNAMGSKLLIFGATYALLGVVALLYLHFNHKLKEVAQNTAQQSTDSGELSDPVLPAPQGSQRPPTSV